MAKKVAVKQKSQPSGLPFGGALQGFINAGGGALQSLLHTGGGALQGIGQALSGTNGAAKGYADAVSNAYKKGISGGALQGYANTFAGPKVQKPQKNSFDTSAFTNLANSLPKPTQDASQPYTYLDALNQAQQLYGGGAGSVDYSPLIAQTRQTYGDAGNRLLAMYTALHNSFQNDAPGVASIFDQAKTADQAAADSATNAINQAYTNAQNSQTKQFNELGIGDALANIVANHEGTTQADQANALSRVATSNQANQNQLGTNKAAALNYNTGIAQSALQGGTDRAANLQSQLAQAVAQLQQQQATANAQIQQANNSGVQSLANDIWNSVLNGQKLSQQQANDLATQQLAQSKSNQSALQQQVSQAIAMMKANPSLAFNDALASVTGAYQQ